MAAITEGGRILLVVTIWVAIYQRIAGQGQLKVDDIRLRGGTSTSGRLEVLVGGTWGTVCDDSWDDKDATVICQQLQRTGGTATKLASFGQGTGTIFLDDVDCKGNEKNINECYFTTGAAVNCDHTEDAGVICGDALATTPIPAQTTTIFGVTQPSNCTGGNNANSLVRLIGPADQPGVGYVQVRANTSTNNFGYVCDDFWDVNAAKVVCRELCFSTMMTEPGMRQQYYVTVTNPTFALDDVRCRGDESTLVTCQHAPWGINNCIASELASVTCMVTDYPTPELPIPDLQCREGKLIALFSKARDPNLEPKYFSLATTCSGFIVVTTRTASGTEFISVTIPYEDCGTNVTQNATHISYFNVVFLESTSRIGAITKVNNYRIELTCDMPRNYTVDHDFRPLTETVTKSALGLFNITMTIYQDLKFLQPVQVYPYPVTLGHWINVAVELESVDSRLLLVVTDCIATPDLHNPNAPRISLLSNKCIDMRVGMEVYPLTRVKFGLRIMTFAFVGYPIVVLQCKAIVCLMTEVTSECDRTCNNAKPTPANGRRRRDVIETATESVASSGPKTVYTVSSFPIVITEPLNISTELPMSPTPLPPTITTTFTTTTPTTTTTAPPAATKIITTTSTIPTMQSSTTSTTTRSSAAITTTTSTTTSTPSTTIITSTMTTKMTAARTAGNEGSTSASPPPSSLSSPEKIVASSESVSSSSNSTSVKDQGTTSDQTLIVIVVRATGRPDPAPTTVSSAFRGNGISVLSAGSVVVGSVATLVLAMLGVFSAVLVSGFSY